MVKKTHRLRVLIVALFSFLLFGIIEARLYYIQIPRHEHYRQLARNQQNHTITLHPRRGDILDRRGQIIATSTFYDTVFFEPSVLEDPLPKQFAHDLAAILEMSDEEAERILGRTRRTRVQRNLPPETVMAMRLLLEKYSLPRRMFSYEKKSKRLYPKGAFAGPVIGFAGNDPYGENVGLEGLEHFYDDVLGGKLQKQKVTMDVHYHRLAPVDEGMLRESFGNSLVLTIDSQIQHYAQQALRAKVEEVKAESGVVVAMDVETGEILAMVSYPDYDPNRFGAVAGGHRRNRALTDPVEVGSVMKIFTTAILLDNNLLSVEEMIDCQMGRASFDGRTIRDSHDLGVVPFREAFAESSNIGMATVAMRLEPNLYYDGLTKFSVGQRTGIDLPGESTGVLRTVDQWTKLSRASLPLGYETSLTALQVVTGLSAVANGGKRMRPYVVREILSADGRTLEKFGPVVEAQIIGPETAKIMMELMREVVEHGTGKNAQVPGYSVAGKTGTTRKVMPGRHYIASFAGVVPASNPRLAIYCFVNEPDPKIAFYGGSVAAPVFAEVAEKAARFLEIPPDMPVERQNEFPPDEEARRLHQIAEGETLAPSPQSALADADDAGRMREWSTVMTAGSIPEFVGGAVIPGRMPHCLGLTMTEVLGRMAEAGIEVKFFGSGVAVRQSPLPGQAPDPGQEAIVIFDKPSRVGEIATAEAPLQSGQSVLPQL